MTQAMATGLRAGRSASTRRTGTCCRRSSSTTSTPSAWPAAATAPSATATARGNGTAAADRRTASGRTLDGPSRADARDAPVRIGIACPYSWDVPGGVQQHIRDLAEALIELGHEVSVIAPGRRGPAAAALRRPHRPGDAGAVQRLGGPALVRPAVGQPGAPLAPRRRLRRAARARADRAVAAAARLLGGVGADRGDGAHRDAASPGCCSPPSRCSAPRWRRSTAGSRCPRRRGRRSSSTWAATRC